MDPFTVNQQIEELGYVVISDMNDEELEELLMIKENDKE